MTALPGGTVTFLFADIAGSTRLWEQHPQAMQEALARHNRLLRQAIEGHGGAIFKFVGDACCAAFASAPAALRAALEAQRALQAEPWGATGPITVRMALHTGIAEQRDDDDAGPILNRLSRLLDAVHGGQVLLSAVTYGLVQDSLPAEVTLLDLGEQPLPDLLRPEHMYQLVAPELPRSFPPLRLQESAASAGSTMSVICLSCGATSAPRGHFCSACGSLLDSPGSATAALPSSSLIGRQRELLLLQARLDEAGRGSGSLVLLAGEAGIGKSRLAREIATRAPHAGACALWGACLEGGGQPPYGPWVEALDGFVRRQDHARLRALAEQEAAVLARLLPAVRSALPGLPAAAPLSPDEERMRLYQAVVELLQRASQQQPLLLVLDDLHWADRDSLALLRYVARTLPQLRLLLVATYRDPDPHLREPGRLLDMLAQLSREIDYARVALHGLSEPEVASYLARQAGQRIPLALVQAIHAESNGNPFFVREVFRHLVEEGRLIRREGRWSTDFSISELGIPASIRQVLSRRMAHLSQATRSMLLYAAAFSGAVSSRELQAASQLPEEQLLDALDEALGAGLLRPTGSPAGTYEFVHAIVRHTLYEELNPDRRMRLRRRIASTLVQLYADELPAHAAEIAAQYHASAALPGAEQGLPYSLLAAEQAQEHSAHERAVAFLRMARELATDGSAATRADVLCRLALAEAQALMQAEAEATATQALAALAQAAAPASQVAGFLGQVTRALKEGGASSTLWEPLLERGLVLAGAQHDLLWARLMLLRDRFEPISHGPINTGRWLGHDREAIAIAQASGDADDYARTLDPLDWRTPEETAAVLTLARRWERPTAIMRALDVVARDLLYRQDAVREAAERYEELLRASERYGSIPGQAEALAQLAGIHCLLGDFQRVRQLLGHAHELIARLGAVHRLHFNLIGVSILQAYYQEGDWRSLAHAAAQYCGRSQSRRSPLGLMAAACAALAYACAGEPPEAQRFLAALTPLLQRMEPRMYFHNTVVNVAGMAVWQLQLTELAPAYRQFALALLDTGVSGGVMGPHELTIARMASLLGASGEALLYFQRAQAALDAAGARPLRSIADYEQAGCLLRSGAAASAAPLLQAALAGFQELGLAAWQRRAHALEAQLARAMSPATPAHPGGLTTREVEVLRLVAQGLTNKQIAARLVVSLPTVERHIANIYAKIQARNRADATTYALSHGLLPLEPA